MSDSTSVEGSGLDARLVRAGDALRARAERLAGGRSAWIAGGLVVALVLAVFLLRQTFPNYDSYYTLIWGDELAGGSLPDYDVFRTPTPHPLSTLAAALLSLLGGVSDRVLVLVTLASWLVLLGLLFRITQILLGSLVALVAVLVLLTRTDIEFFSLRAVVDVPFLALVFGAVLMELERPRRGWPVFALLALAGLLRPEAWVLAGAYWLWLALAPPRPDLRTLAWWALLAAAAPIGWLAADWIVTGEPLYSLTSTREVAGQFQRDRSVPEAIKLIPDYVGANEKIVNVVAGGLGALLALWLLRMRAALLLGLVGVGTFVFLAIAAAGLSVIPRYLVIPSLVLNLCVACALVGWTLVEDRRMRRAAFALAVLSLLLVAWRAPAYLNDFRKLNGQTKFVENQHRDLQALLDRPEVLRLVRDCERITVPTHSAIPVLRYETGIGKERLEASIQQTRPPQSGLLLIGATFNFEPAAARATTGIGSRSAQKWWSNYPLSTFTYVAGNERWKAYENC